MNAPEPRRAATRPKSARNIGANWSAFAFSVLVNLFLTPFIVSSLGDAAYGIWVLLASLVGYMGLLDLGVRSAVMRYVARFHAKAEDDDASEFASTGMAIFLIAGAVAILAASVLAILSPFVFNIPPDFVTVTRQVLMLGGVNIAFALVAGVYGGVVSAMQRFDLRSLMEIGIGTVRATAIVVALRANHGLVALAVVQLSCTLLRMAGEAWLARRLYPELEITPKRVRLNRIRPIFSFAAFSSLLYVSRTVILSASALIIGIFLPVQQITFFSIGASLMFYVRQVIASIAATVTPRASAMQAVLGQEEVGILFLSMARLSSLVVAPITLTLLIRGQTFIEIWMGESYGDLSGRIIRILALSLPVTAPGQILMSALIGMRRHRSLVPFQIGEAFLNVGVSVLWIGTWGIVGVAWGNTLPTLAVSVIAVPWLTRKTMDIPVHHLAIEVFLRPWIAMIPFALATVFIEVNWRVDDLLLYFVQVALALPLAAAGAWLFSTSPSERVAIVGRVRSIKQRIIPRA